MRKCEKIVRRIRESDGELDGELLVHCLECGNCRNELAALLAASDAGTFAVPGELDVSVTRACRNGRKRKIRHRMKYSMICSGAAAALFCISLPLWHFSPAEPPLETGSYAIAPDWDGGGALLGELSDINTEITRTQEMLNPGGGRNKPKPSI